MASLTVTEESCEKPKENSVNFKLSSHLCQQKECIPGPTAGIQSGEHQKQNASSFRDCFKGTRKNKNLFPRRSMSSINMAATANESDNIHHSKSYSGNPGNTLAKLTLDNNLDTDCSPQKCSQLEESKPQRAVTLSNLYVIQPYRETCETQGQQEWQDLDISRDQSLQSQRPAPLCGVQQQPLLSPQCQSCQQGILTPQGETKQHLPSNQCQQQQQQQQQQEQEFQTQQAQIQEQQFPSKSQSQIQMREVQTHKSQTRQQQNHGGQIHQQMHSHQDQDQQQLTLAVKQTQLDQSQKSHQQLSRKKCLPPQQGSQNGNLNQGLLCKQPQSKKNKLLEKIIIPEGQQPYILQQKAQTFVYNRQYSFLNPKSPAKDTPNFCYSEWLQQKWPELNLNSFDHDAEISDQFEESEKSTGCVEKRDLGINKQINMDEGVLQRHTAREEATIETFHERTFHLSSTSVSPAATTGTATGGAHDQLTATFTEMKSYQRQEDISEDFSATHRSVSLEVDCVPISASASPSQTSSSQTSSTVSVPSIQSSAAWPKQSLTSQPTPCSVDQSNNQRRDFVLINADGDQEEAHDYADHLRTKVAIQDLSVDLFSDIDSGQTDLASAETLHNRYNYILVLGNKNLKDDKFSRFLHQNILTSGLREGNGKENRVIPVWTCTESKLLIFEFQCLKGFEYYKFISAPNSAAAHSYIKCVQNTVQAGRKMHE